MKYIRHQRNFNGFTLVEITLVVAVLGLLIMVNYSNNKPLFDKGREAMAKAFLLEISHRQASYMQQHNTYAENLSELGAVPINSLASYYRIELIKSLFPNNQSGYTAKAIPIMDEDADKTLWINHLGATNSNWGN
ncbi:MAG: type IV pilin protein [Porticoccaceae bacterium]|nr:type IV pilin protein [Porticoccaceae bacterium]